MTDIYSISMNTLEDIWDENYIHTDINGIYAIFKIRNHIRLAISKWKGEELSPNQMGKFLHKVFKVVVKWLKD